jgi:uncharacterized protein (DUF2249 family)
VNGTLSNGAGPANRRGLVPSAINNPNVTLDVREDIRAGREPFSKIMNTVAQLSPDENLLLLAPFEPVPLFSVLGKMGFTHRSRKLESGDWELLFTRNGKSTKEAEDSAPVRREERQSAAKATVIDVDARGLEPPQPMVKILEVLNTLPDGAELRARTDRRPMHLYGHLEARGFAGQTEEQNDGSFVTHIRRG